MKYEDKVLFEYLKQYEGKKIQLPKDFKPDLNFLDWHQKNKFLRN
ncbi:hypothetical protein LLI02_003102 [Acinetobacter baumannii]